VKILRFSSSAAVIALGLVLAPTAFARGGGGGHGGGFGGHGFAGGREFAGHVGGDRLAHFGPHGGHPVYGPGGIFYGYDFGYGFGMAYPGYITPSYCYEYPNDYNPSAGCYWPYSG
jgi:hypothetical protein